MNSDGVSYLVDLVINALIIMLMNYLFNGFYVDGFVTALLVAFVLSLLNAFVKPVIEAISLPVTFITLGLFKLVINGFILYLADLILGSHFTISGVWMMIFSALLMSLLSSLLGVNQR